ncbi:MAG: hypothetical protein COA54_01200 [Thiotrichaceae bacterium]|nr:MAG: hypothetical protein COA54_01200 [Thiotrichaceae bacterium]
MLVTDLGSYMLIGIVAMSISMILIPLMIRLAPAIGMIDQPDSRKVHTEVIPRVGGIGIVIGLIVPILIWASQDTFVQSLIIGCSVLLIFGAWDDARELSPVVKLIGQIVAALTIVYYGDVYVFNFPFMESEEISELIGRPFTVIAIVGMINALNLSDGLDGLAGGEALLSLLAMAYMAYQFEGGQVLIVIVATIGGIFGFLRFNSHPARVFMGDSGSQTLGFILGSLVVYMSQNLNSAISPVVPLLLLGLPVIDSIVVFALRAHRGTSLVTAAKDHLHHRLLARGFYHYESVMIIYTLQVVLVVSAIFLPYESDALLMLIYFGTCFLAFALLIFSEKINWCAHDEVFQFPNFLVGVFGKNDTIIAIPYRMLKTGISLFVVSAAIMSVDVPVDFGVSSLFLLLVVMASKWFGHNLYRLVMFITIGFSVYLLSTYPPVWLLDKISLVYLFFISITILTFINARLIVKEQFQVTPLDYLVVVMAVVVSAVPGIDQGASSLVWIVVQMIILFYACELVIQNMKGHLNSCTGAIALALALIAYRGLV